MLAYLSRSYNSVRYTRAAGARNFFAILPLHSGSVERKTEGHGYNKNRGIEPTIRRADAIYYLKMRNTTLTNRDFLCGGIVGADHARAADVKIFIVSLPLLILADFHRFEETCNVEMSRFLEVRNASR